MRGVDGTEKTRGLKKSVWVPMLGRWVQKKCECSFRLKGRKLPGDDDWMLEVVCGAHNHWATDYLEDHSYVSRLSKEEYSLLKDMPKSNV